MSDKLLHFLLHKHDRYYKFPKANMSRTVTDIFPIDQNKLFKVEKVEHLMHDLIDKNVDESFVYNSEECPKLCLNLTEELRKSIKELNFERYKFICMVQIFEKKTQGISSISRLMCDTERDRYVVVRKENNSIYLIASIYALYHP